MGPDQIPNIFLKKTAIHTAELLTYIFNQSISSHSLPKDWLQANINPLFKKGNTNLAVNYRPVSLTCVCCKLLEHILYSHIMGHLQTNNLLSVNQHGFRSGFSCETQLILTVHDLLESFEHKHRVDIGVLEYASSVWDPHLRKDIHHLEMVQRRAARFIKRDYSYESSVTQMTYHPWKTEEKLIN